MEGGQRIWIGLLRDLRIASTLILKSRIGKFTDSTSEPMAGPGETAQVHPYQFTMSMCALAQEKGAKVVIGKATTINRDSGTVTSVSYADGQTGEAGELPAVSGHYFS